MSSLREKCPTQVESLGLGEGRAVPSSALEAASQFFPTVDSVGSSWWLEIDYSKSIYTIEMGSNHTSEVFISWSPNF